MKTKLFLIPAGLLFFVILIYTSSSYTDSQTLFVLRHISIYLIFVSLVIIGQLYIQQLLLKKLDITSHTLWVKGSIVVMGAIVLMFIANLQLQFIQSAQEENLPIACDYYDSNGTILYQSLTSSCATVEFLQETNHIQEYIFTEVGHYEDAPITITQHVTVTYGDYNIVTDMLVTREEKQELKSGTVTASYKYHQTATTTMPMDVVQQFYSFSIEDNEYILNHANMYRLDVDSIDQYRTTISLSVKDLDDSRFHHLHSIDIEELVRDNGDGTISRDDTWYSMRLETPIFEYMYSEMDIPSGERTKSISVQKGNLSSQYVGVEYIESDFGYRITQSHHRLSEYLKAQFVQYQSYDIVETKSTTYESIYKRFEVSKLHDIIRIRTYSLETLNGRTKVDPSLQERDLYKTYDYITRIENLQDFDDYLIYRYNPLIDNVIYVVLKEVLYQ